jgi:hypothetical protein
MFTDAHNSTTDGQTDSWWWKQRQSPKRCKQTPLDYDTPKRINCIQQPWKLQVLQRNTNGERSKCHILLHKARGDTRFKSAGVSSSASCTTTLWNYSICMTFRVIEFHHNVISLLQVDVGGRRMEQIALLNFLTLYFHLLWTNMTVSFQKYAPVSNTYNYIAT